MLRSLLARFTRTRGKDGEDGDDEDDEQGEFLRSRLDASVLSAHGMGTEKADSELADVEQQGRELEEYRHDR